MATFDSSTLGSGASNSSNSEQSNTDLAQAAVFIPSPDPVSTAINVVGIILVAGAIYYTYQQQRESFGDSGFDHSPPVTERIPIDTQSPNPEAAIRQRFPNQQVEISPEAQAALSRTEPNSADFEVIAEYFRNNVGQTYSPEQIQQIQSVVGAPQSGTYDGNTAQRVYEYQQRRGLPADGEAGDNTYREMFGTDAATQSRQQADQDAAQQRLAEAQRNAAEARLAEAEANARLAQIEAEAAEALARATQDAIDTNNDRHDLLWRGYIESYPPEQQARLIQTAVEAYLEDYPDEPLDPTNPQPEHPSVFSLHIYSARAELTREPSQGGSTVLSPPPVEQEEEENSEPTEEQENESPEEPQQRPPGDDPPGPIYIDPDSLPKIPDLPERGDDPVVPDLDPRRPEDPEEENIQPPQAQQQSGAENEGAEGAQNETQEESSEGNQESSTDQERFAERFVGKKLEDLTSEELEALETAYSIYENQNGTTVLSRRDVSDGYPPLHVDSEGVIQPGGQQQSNRISNPGRMNRNFREANGTSRPEGDQGHHLIPDAEYQKHDLTQEAMRREAEGDQNAANVDDNTNQISLPGTPEAFENNDQTVQDLEESGARARVLHSGSHPKYNEAVRQELDRELDKLLEAHPGKTLQEIPTEEINQAIENVSQYFRQQFIDAAENIREGNLDELPDWIDPTYQRDGQVLPRTALNPTSPQNSFQAMSDSRSPQSQNERLESESLHRQAQYPKTWTIDDVRTTAIQATDESDFTNASRAIALSNFLLEDGASSFHFNDYVAYREQDQETRFLRAGTYEPVATRTDDGTLTLHGPLTQSDEQMLQDAQEILLSQQSITQERSSLAVNNLDMVLG